MRLYTVIIASAWFLFFTIATTVFPYQQAKAAAGNWKTANGFKARLTVTGEDKSGLHALLEMHMDPGAHIHWKNPGDSGLAPDFDWTTSQNIKNIDLSWPIPKRFEYFGMYTFGYDGYVAFPITFKREEEEKDSNLSLDAEIMVCNVICMPNKVVLELPVEKILSENQDLSSSYNTALRKLPSFKNIPALQINSAVAGPEAFVVNAHINNTDDNIDMFIESGDIPLNSPPEIIRPGGNEKEIILKVPSTENDNLATLLKNKEIVVTIVNGDKAVEKEFRFCALPQSPEEKQKTELKACDNK